jgi:hypothetical protein
MKPTVCLAIAFGSLETKKYRSANHSRPSRRSHAVDSEASSEMKTEETTMVDETKLNQFIGKILGDLGGVFSAPLVRMGDKLGLYKALKEQGP